MTDKDKWMSFLDVRQIPMDHKFGRKNLQYLTIRMVIYKVYKIQIGQSKH